MHAAVGLRHLEGFAELPARLAGVRVVRTRLGEAAADGRARPVEVPDSEFVLPVALAVEAVGEGLDPAAGAILAGVEIGGGVVRVDPATGATSRRGVFAAGDLINGGTTVARALAEGRTAAEAMDRLIRLG